MRPILALCLLTGSAFPAVAQDLLQRPRSCELVATAQYSSCEVYNHFKCSGTAPVVYRVESIDQDGLFTVETYDKVYGALGLADTSGELEVSLSAKTEHPRVALETGLRSEAFEGSMKAFGATLNLIGGGEYRYDGETLVIAGETFHRMPFEGEATISGLAFGTELNLKVTVKGSMIYNDRLDLWLEEHSRTKAEGEPEEDSRLKLLSLPGQNGFGESVPKFGCPGQSLLDSLMEAPA